MASIGSVVLPGDALDFLSNIDDDASKIILGPGLRRNADQVFASKCGTLQMQSPNIYWVDSHEKRYIPIPRDDVVGIVTSKSGDSYRVDIGASEQASISYLAFEGATKRNRPDIQIGDLLYAKLLLASKDMEPELVCVDSYGKSKGLGILSGGFTFQVPLNLVRKLRSASYEQTLQKCLEKIQPFEWSLGMNGRVWIKAKTVKETIIICNVLSLLEHVKKNEIDFAVEKIYAAAVSGLQ